MRLLFTFALAAITTLSQAQEQGSVKYIQIAAPGVIQADTMANETIEHCDAMIRAIDNKVAYVQSDQTMRDECEANGWFDKMAYTRSRFVSRREALIKTGSNK